MSTPAGDFWESLPLGDEVRLITRDSNGLAAFAKPAGTLSHPNDAKDQSRSLLTARYDAQAQCFTWTDAGTARRLWLLNRLDSATSGVILAAASEKLAETIRAHFLQKQVRKVYQALVFGRPERKSDLWEDLLAVKKGGGQVRTAGRGNIPAQTEFQLVRHAQRTFSTSLIRLEPRTGRSHQLRVQCAKRHLPIIGDQTYGDFALNRAFTKATQHKRMFLHSLESAFTYEFAGRSHSFHAAAPLPPEFQQEY